MIWLAGMAYRGQAHSYNKGVKRKPLILLAVCRIVRPASRV